MQFILITIWQFQHGYFDDRSQVSHSPELVLKQHRRQKHQAYDASSPVTVNWFYRDLTSLWRISADIFRHWQSLHSGDTKRLQANSLARTLSCVGTEPSASGWRSWEKKHPNHRHTAPDYWDGFSIFGSTNHLLEKTHWTAARVQPGRKTIEITFLA